MGQLISSHQLPALVKQGLLPGRLYSKSLSLFRNAKAWDGWALRALLALGAGHVLAGIIFFFAYNWHDLSQVMKFGLVLGGMVLSAIAWIGLKLDKPIAQVFGISLTVLIGVFLAVFGQVFQTPAALYTPFTLWAVMALPFAAVSRSLAHWAVWLVVAFVAANMYIVFGLGHTNGDSIYFWAYALVAAVFFALLIAYDRIQNIWPDWARAGWFRVLLVMAGFVFANIAFAIAVLDNHINWAWPVIPVIGLYVLIYLYKLNHDGFAYPPLARIACLVLTATGLGAMAAQIGLRAIGELMDKGDAFVFGFLLGFLWMAGVTFILAKAFKHFGTQFKHEQDIAAPSQETVGTPKGDFNPSNHLNAETFATELQIDPATVQDVLQVDADDIMPWYMEMFLGFAGFFTAILAMLFLGTLLAVTMKIDSPGSFLTLGLVVYAGAMFARLKTNGLFPRHFFNTLLMGGGALAVFGAALLVEGEIGFILFSMALSALTLWLVRDRILEFLMAAGFAGVLVYALLHYHVPYAFICFYAICAALGVLSITRPIKAGVGASRQTIVLGAAGAAFLLAPCFFELTGIADTIKTMQARMIFGADIPNMPDRYQIPWLRLLIPRLLSALIAGAAIWYLNTQSKLKSEMVRFRPPLLILMLLLVAMAIMPLGSAAALLVLLTGYILGHRSLTIVGSLAQIAYIVWYYYDMDITLLNKSLLLMGFGAILLLVYFIAFRRGGRHV